MGKTGIDEEFKMDLNTLKSLTDGIPIYHEAHDTFFIRPEHPVAATSFDWNGELWLRINQQTGAIVGLEIENFESVFLKTHPKLAKVWKDVKPHCARRKIQIHDDDDVCESFIMVLIDLLSAIFKDSPQQADFGLA